MCLYNTFPCVSHDAEALHRTLFEENNAGAAFQVFRCKWYYCANLNLKAGSKLCPYVIIQHGIKKLQIQEHSQIYKAVLENEVIDHGCKNCWVMVREKDWVQVVHTQMAKDLNMMPAVWAETLGDEEEEAPSMNPSSATNEDEQDLMIQEKGKRKRGCSEISIPPPHWANKSRKVCKSDVASSSGLVETDSEPEEDREDVESELDQEEMDLRRACQESMELFEREHKGKGKEKEGPAQSSSAVDVDEVEDAELEWALRASIEEQEATKKSRRSAVDKYMTFGSGGESSKSVMVREQNVTPPNSQKGVDATVAERAGSAPKGYEYDIVTLLKEKAEWQLEKSELVTENAKVLRTNVAHVERERELMRRVRDLEELCFPTQDDDADVAENEENGE
ncbi:hypothetical protein LTS17_006844 [Exophiala oligosperma]